MKGSVLTPTQIIRDILLEGKVSTQDEIRKELQKRDLKVSQPNVSRLLHKIGAVKLVDGEGKTQYRLPHETRLIHELTSTQEKNIMSEWVLDIVSNETLIVMYTTPGAASMVARIVDQHRASLNVIGTIAGDDAIFVAPKQGHPIQEIVRQIRVLFKV